MHTRWADPLDEVLKPDVIVEDVEKERLAHAQAERRRELEEQVAVYAEPEDVSEALAEARRRITEYQTQLVERQRWDAAESVRVELQNLIVPAHSSEELSQARSEEHTSELQSLMRISYAVFCLKK